MIRTTHDGWFADLNDPQFATALAGCPTEMPDQRRGGSARPAEQFILVEAHHFSGQRCLGLFFKPLKPTQSVFGEYLTAHRPRPWRVARLGPTTLEFVSDSADEPNWGASLAVDALQVVPSTFAALGFVAFVVPTAATAKGPSGNRTADILVVPRDAEEMERLVRDLLRISTVQGGMLLRDLRRVPVQLTDRVHAPLHPEGLVFAASAHDLPLLVPAGIPLDFFALARAELARNLTDRPAAAVYRITQSRHAQTSRIARDTGRKTHDTTKRTRSETIEETSIGLEWGCAFSKLTITRDFEPQWPVEASPLWRPFASDPAGVVWLRDARPMVDAGPLQVPVIRLDGHTPPTKSTAAGAMAPVAFQVPFRLVMSPTADEPRAWLMFADELARLRAILQIQPSSRLEGVEIAPISEIGAHLIRRKRGQEFIDVPGLPLAPLPGCPRAYVPLGWTIRPRLNPGRLPGLLDLPADAVTVLVPQALGVRNGRDHAPLDLASALASHSTPAAGTAPGKHTGKPRADEFSDRDGRWVDLEPQAFEQIRVPNSQFRALAEAVRYTLELGLSERTALPVPELLDSTSLLAFYDPLSQWRDGFLQIQTPGRVGERPVQPSPMGRSERRIDVPLSVPAGMDSTVPEEPAVADMPLTIEIVPTTPVEPDRLIAEERQLESALAEELHEPGRPALKPLWFKLGGIKRGRRKIGEALYCWVNARWFTADPTATVLPLPIPADADMVRELAHLAGVTTMAPRLPDFTIRSMVGELETAPNYTAEHFVWFLLAVEQARLSGTDPETVIRLQRLFSRLRGVMPFKLRWLIGAGIARLGNDEVGLEREREDLLGELNVHGLAMLNIEPMVNALLGLGASKASGDALRGSTGGATRWAADDSGEPGSTVTRAWPAKALKSWVETLEQFTPAGRGHSNVGFVLAVGEMLLTISRQWGRKHLPLAAVQKLVERGEQPLLGAIVRTHLAEFRHDDEPSDDRRIEALTKLAEVIESDDAEFMRLPPDQRTRIANYIALLGQRWASPVVRKFWQEFVSEASIEVVTDLIGCVPKPWFALLGQHFVTQQFLKRLEAESRNVVRFLARPVSLLHLLDELKGMMRGRDLPPLLADDLPLPAVVAEEAARQIDALFATIAPRVQWQSQVKDLAPVLARLEHLNAPKLDFKWSEPRDQTDWRWLQSQSPLFIARASQLAIRGDRQASLALIEQLVTAWREKYPQLDQIPAAVRSNFKWFIDGVLTVVPLIGNRIAGARLIKACLDHGRSGDVRTQSALYSAAARALALLGERSEAESMLAALLVAADESVSQQDIELFEVLEQVMNAGLELLTPETFRDKILRPVRTMVQKHFRGKAGTSYRLQLNMLISFTEWSLAPNDQSVPMLKAKKDSDLPEGDRLPIALHWATTYLRCRAYEQEHAILKYFSTLHEFIGPANNGFSSVARTYMQALTDHFLGDASSEHKALHDFRRLEEILIRNRVAWEQL